MMSADKSSSRSGKKVVWFFVFLIFTGGAGFAAYNFGPGLYYRFTGDAILRIRKRTDTYEDYLTKKNKSVSDLYTYIIDSRKLFKILLKDDAADSEIYFHQGLFEFYELILRSQLNSTSLIQLTGRGYLPQELKFPEIPYRSMRDTAETAGNLMRKSQAIDPGMSEEKLALSNLIIITSDVLYTGRTDPQLLKRLEKVQPNLLSEPYKPYDLWIRLALYTVMGKSQEMEILLKSLQEENQDLPLASGSPLLQSEKELLLSHLYFNTENYLKSLISARNVKYMQDVDPSLKSEAVRMEAEIFLLQRGPVIAKIFFNEALILSEGNDPFIKERLSAIEVK